MFRLLVKTTKRLIETRGLRAAGTFAAHFLRALPSSAAWAAYVEKICMRRFGGAVPLDLITTGIVPAKRQSSKRLQALRAHYDVLDTYFGDAVLARLLFGRPLAMSVFSADSGTIYGLDLVATSAALRPEGELMIVLRGEDRVQPIGLLPLCFAAAGHRGISLHLGHMRLSPEADEAARDLYAMPVKAAIMDAVYALVSVFGVTELTAPAGNDAFWADCGGEPSDGAFRLPLEGLFWRSKTGRAALGENWVPQQMLRTVILPQCQAAVSSWLRFDETTKNDSKRKPATVAANEG